MDIHTTTPIPFDQLKKYFDSMVEGQNPRFLIDYQNSAIKGETFLTYLANLNVRAELQDGCDYELYLAYLKARNLVSIETLDKVTMSRLFQMKFNPEAQFTDEEKTLLVQWTNVLNSLVLYNLYCINSEEIREEIRKYPRNESKDLSGINFVNLLQYEEFFDFYTPETSKDPDLAYYDVFFNDYVFRGQNLFQFWATEKNTMFMMTCMIAGGNGPELVNIMKDHAPAV